jgi:hypothetical protein
MSDMIEITYEEYKRLLEAERMLGALEGAGVDNWEGYDYAMEMLEQEDD